MHWIEQLKRLRDEQQGTVEDMPMLELPLYDLIFEKKEKNCENRAKTTNNVVIINLNNEE